MKFDLECIDKFSQARAGSIYTERGLIKTPIFMPVGTSATVKGVHQRELENDIKPDILMIQEIKCMDIEFPDFQLISPCLGSCAGVMYRGM